VQTAQLQHVEEQEKRSRSARDEQVLPFLQEAHGAQGDPLTNRVHRKAREKPMPNTAEGKNKNASSGKVGSFFVNLIPRCIRPFKDMYAELHKVTWATRQNLKNYSIVVLVFMVFMGFVIGIFDGLASEVVRRIVGG